MAKSARYETALSAAWAGSPIQWAMLERLGQTKPKWTQLREAGMDQLDWKALADLIATNVIQLRIAAEMRCKGFLGLLRATVIASGQNVDSLVDEHIKRRAANSPDYVNDKGCIRPGEIRKTILATRLSAAGVFVFRLSRWPGDEMLDWLTVAETITSGRVSAQPPKLEIEHEGAWIPSELQVELWNALDCRAMNADDLENTLAVARATLFKKPSGLPELVDLGFVKNDRAHGGYYRPDAPPQDLN